MNLDIGNFRPPKVYEQVEMSVPYAVSTHFKTTIANDDGQTRSPYDWDRVMKMFVAGGYKGYLGLEFEATGDPAVEVPGALPQADEAAAATYSRLDDSVQPQAPNFEVQVLDARPRTRGMEVGRWKLT